MSALLQLAERCEKATGPDQGLDIAIHTAATSFEPLLGGLGWPKWAIIVPAFPGWKLLPEYTASVDAAMTLVPEGWDWSTGTDGSGRGHSFLMHAASKAEIECDTATPALALCAAALRARAAA